jgi:hypothetical protein
VPARARLHVLSRQPVPSARPRSALVLVNRAVFGWARSLRRPCSSLCLPCTLGRLLGYLSPLWPARPLLLSPRTSLAQLGRPENLSEPPSALSLLPWHRVSPSNVAFTPRARRADFKPGIASPLHPPACTTRLWPSPRSYPVRLTQRSLPTARHRSTHAGIPPPHKPQTFVDNTDGSVTDMIPEA